jgi:protein-S-isoprenylcysteine O-methyltransferase Ste14
MSKPRDASSPVIWPPIIYGMAALLSALAAWFAPWSFLGSFLGPRLTALFGSDWRLVVWLIGGAMIFAGLATALAAEMRFKAAGTPVPPTRPTKAIVSTGIYGWTRNPMYLGMTLCLLGLGLGLDQLWFVIATPIAMACVTKLAIEREEAYLAAKFGATYLDYKAQVRRWL